MMTVSVATGADDTGGTTGPASLPDGAAIEEEAPGVLRIVNDGVRDLAGWNVATGRDGSVWLTSKGLNVPLGEPDGIAWLEGDSSGVIFDVAPDGLVWVVEDTPDKPFVRIRSFDGERWQTHRKTRADSLDGWALDIAADGTVWAAWPDQEMREGQRAWVVARLHPDGWRFLDAPYRGDQLVDLTVTDDEEVWVHDLADGPFRYEDAGWQPAWTDADPVIAADAAYPDDEVERTTYDGAVGSDGTVWLILEGPPASPMDAIGVCDALLRFDGDRWHGYGMPADAGENCHGIDVAPDGSVWLTPTFVEDLPGLLRFDGTTWESYLADRQVLGSVSFGTDGSAWVVSEPAFADSRRQRSIHVVTPEVTAPDDHPLDDAS